jgi:hypothetical protein
MRHGIEEEWIRMDMERSRMLERDEEERIIMLKERIIEERIDRYRERIKRNEEEEERNETYWERDERRFREEERERNRETNKLNRRIERIRMNWWLHLTESNFGYFNTTISFCIFTRCKKEIHRTF